MSYGVKYRLNYCNKDGDEFRLDIEIDGYSGEIFPIEGTAVPFVLTMHNNNEFPKLETIRATEATIEVYEDDNINIDSLLTSNETAIRISHYKNGNLNWQGFAVPDFYHVSIEDARVISITASDRLGALKSIGADEYYGQDGLINILRRCLLKTGLKLNIKTIIGLNSTDVVLKNMPLTNLVLCDRLFNQRGEAINCYDVIRSICDMFNCFITQKDGYWWIVNKEQLELGTGEIVEYSWDGDDFEAVEVTDFNRQTIDFDLVDTGGERMVRPVLREVGILGEFGGSIAYPQNNDFRNWNGSNFPGWIPYNSFVRGVFTGNVREYNPNGTIKDFEPGSKNKLLNRNATFEYYDTSNPNTLPYLESTAIPIVPDDAKDNKVTVEYSFNATCKNDTMLLFGLVLETPNTKNKYYVLRGSDGTWVPGGNNKNSLYGKEKEAPWYYEDILAGVLPWITSKVVNTEVDPNAAIGVNVSGSVVIDAATAVDFEQCKLYVRIFGAIPLKVYSGDIRTTVIINSVNINIKSSSELPKGNLYKVTREGQFTAKTTFPVSIYSDYITGGINGYFYSYPSDDTSAMFTGWTSEREDTQVMPLLLLVARQMSYLYGEAQNQLNITIDAADVDILAIYRLACKSENYVVSKYTIDYLRGQLTLTLSEIKRPTTDGVPYIYSYFGGDDNVSTIGVGGVSSGGSVGGGTAPQNLQSVTEVGNTTTLDISVRGLRVSDFLVVPNDAPDEDDIVADESYMWLGDGATAGVPDAGTLAGLSDVNITSPTNGQALVWNSATSKWVNGDVASGGGGTWGSITGVLSNQTDLQAALNSKQNVLVSGTNIKTVNGQSVLGSGNIVTPNTTYTATNGITISGSNVISPVYGTTAGTIAQGNDSRINNGQTAYSWGDHGNYGIGRSNPVLDLNGMDYGSLAYTTSATTNNPFEYGAVMSMGGASGSNFQLYGTYVNNADLYIRRQRSGVFYDWYKVWHSGNLRSNAENDARYMQVTAPANSITTGDITNWNTAYSQRHTHANKALLDVINQNLATTASVQFSGANIVDSLVIPTIAPVTPQNGNLWIGDGATAGIPDAGTLVGLSDVNISAPTNGQALVWNATTSKWENATVSGGGGTWGTITGVLSNQTDLQSALNGKANLVHTHPWAQITDRPTTIAGYGITDAYTKSEVNSGFVPYTGANKAIDFNTQIFRIGGDFNKSFSNFERSHLFTNETNNSHFTRLTDVASFSRGNDTTQSDCIVITLPVRVLTRWVMEVDIFSNSLNSMFGGQPTKLLIGAYGTSNIVRSVIAISGADNVKSVSFCRDENNNTVIIIRPRDGVTTVFTYGKVNISNFYHSVIYNADLAVKSNYIVEAVLESSLTGLTTNGTITNAQFNRDNHLWNKGDFTQTNVDNWNTAFGWGNHALAGYAVNGTGGTQVRNNTQLDARYMQVTAPANGITTGDITNWNTAYSQRHTHSNKAFLDTINQNMGTSNTVTFDGVIATTRLRIPTSAPSSPVDGEIWIDTSS